MLTHEEKPPRHCQCRLQVHCDNGIDGDGVQSVPTPIAAGDGPETGKKKSEEKSLKTKKNKGECEKE